MRHTIFLLLISAVLCSAQYQPDEVKNRRLSNPSLGTGYMSTAKTAGVTGVTANLLVKIDATGNVVNAALGDVGILGIATNTVGAGLPVEVATRGIINCVADGATVIGNLLGTGTATAGRCKDLGQTNSTAVSLSLQIVGKALSVSGGAGNPVSVQFYGPGHYGAQVAGTDLPTTAPYWRNYTVSYTNAAFIVASTTATITLQALPANAAIQGIEIDSTTAVTGAGITAVSCSIGDGTTADVYAPPYDWFAAVTNTNLWIDGGAFVTTKAGHNVVLTCTANVNFGDGANTILATGALNIDLEYATRH
jgi:hypothetical protein